MALDKNQQRLPYIKKEKKVLSDVELKEIQFEYNKGTRVEDLAILYDVDKSTIYYKLNQLRQGTQKRPSDSKFSRRLSEKEIEEIRKLWSNGEAKEKIAQKVNCSEASVYNYTRGLPHRKAGPRGPRGLLKVEIAEKATQKAKPIYPVSKPKPIEISSLDKPMIAFNHPPTIANKFVHGTHALDLNERRLYVQMSHDQEHPLWVPLESEKKGILKSITGWFSK